MGLFGNNTEFIADDKINSAMNDLVDNTERELVLVSPWLESDNHLMEKIETLLRDKCDVIIITRPPDGHNQIHAQSLEKLRNLGAEIWLDPILHAKMIICDGSEAVLCSSNMINTSLARNHEVGIDFVENHLIKSAIDYCDQLIEKIKDSPDNTGKKLERGKTQMGFCIVCGKRIPYDATKTKIRCKKCWADNKSDSFKGKYCYICGIEADTSSSKKICLTCFKAKK